MNAMSRVLPFLVALGCASIGFAQQPPARDTPNPNAAGTAVIRGRVVVAGTDRVLSKVEIRAASLTGVNKAALTDGNGRYSIADLPAGRYTVSARKPNYVAVNFGERRPLGNGQPIEVADGKTIDRIDFALPRGGVITGKIVDEFGDPVADVDVMPMRYFFVNGARRLQSMGPGIGTTNDIGEYRIYGLSPGQYFVSATLRNFNFGSDTTDRTAYQPTYYPGTGNVAEAQRIMVQSGQTISGINMTLLPVAASRVSGIALDANGRPMSGAFVNAFPREGFNGMPTGGPVKPDGTFTIAGLPPGDYTLRASSGPDELATADVTVNGTDVSGVQLAPRMPSTLRGRVVFEQAAIPPPSPGAVRINALPIAAAAALMPGPIGGSTVANHDWTFEIKGGGGAAIRVMAFVQTGPTPNQPPNAVTWRVKRVLLAETDITDGGLEWPANSTIDDVVVEMTTRVAEVEATVVDANSTPVRDCVVVMFSPDSQRWVPQSRFFASGRPDAEGRFHGRVPAGDYLIVAFDDPEQMSGIFADPEILSQLRHRATPIAARDDQKQTIQLTLSQPPVY
jgi:hypothetical protein